MYCIYSHHNINLTIINISLCPQWRTVQSLINAVIFQFTYFKHTQLQLWATESTFKYTTYSAEKLLQLWATESTFKYATYSAEKLFQLNFRVKIYNRYDQNILTCWLSLIIFNTCSHSCMVQCGHLNIRDKEITDLYSIRVCVKKYNTQNILHHFIILVKIFNSQLQYTAKWVFM